jgi:uncharacterized protein YjfI (DUF2170 family)
MSWELSSLFSLLSECDQWAVTAEEDCLCVTNTDGLEAFVAVSGQQIIVESVLFAVSQVSDTVALNDLILRTHQIFPLTTVAISTIGDEDYYIAFGALSAGSKEESVLLELEALFDNVAGFLDAYEEHLN